MRALTFREIKTLDTITLEDSVDLSSNFYSVPADYHMKPFFNEGVIKFNCSLNMSLSFYARIASEEGAIEIYVYDKKDYSFERVVRTEVSDDGTLDIQKEESVKWWKIAPANLAENLMRVVCNLMAYISYMIENKDTTIVTATKKLSEGGCGGSTVAKKNTYSFINKDKVIYTYTTDGVRKNTYCRKTKSWWVCGHPRHYKNGTVTWVHPYKKGEGVAVAKNYLVKR